MPDQLGVHWNPGRNLAAVPYAVVVQSDRFRSSAHRVVVPLLAAERFGLPDSDVGPHFVVEGQAVVFDPRQATHVPRAVRGPSVAWLADEDGRTVSALDALVSRAKAMSTRRAKRDPLS